MWKIFFRGVRESIGRCGERAVGTACEGNGFASGPKPGKEGPSSNPEGNTASQVASKSECSQTLLKGLGLGTVVWFTQFARDWHCWTRRHHSQFVVKEDEHRKLGCRYKCLLKVLAGVAKTQPIEAATSESDHFDPIEVAIVRNEDTTSSSSPYTEQEVSDAQKQLKEIGSNIDNILGVCYQNQSKPEMALENFKLAWSGGNVRACYNLGLCYELGVGTDPDPVKAAEYYKTAASLGHVQAAYNLGVYYAQGRGGLPKDKSMAKQLFLEAANKGLLQAKAAVEAMTPYQPPETHVQVHHPPSLHSVAVGT
ncbi:DAP3-binding cell death enhancer 1-like [Cloeon dipterum]|uniref:DAP3-binding cell death enhancer 1-like n=1 Tax=Cloeon dipterum TaxID=197152 RepID=UPI003220433F